MTRNLHCVVPPALLAATLLGPARAQTLEWRRAATHEISSCQMVYDFARDRFVAMLDDFAPHLLEATEWDGTQWREHSTVHAPTPRQAYGLAYDITRSRVVLFGGMRSVSGTLLDDLWEYDGADWVERTPTVRPPARRGHAITFDLARGNVLMTGGFGGGALLTDTWRWDGVAWHSIPAASPLFPVLAIASHPSTGKVVLVGYPDNSLLPVETWQFDGVAWTRSTVLSPPRGAGYRMATDIVGDRILLLVGDVGAVWQWNGTAWSVLPASFDGRRYAGLAADGQGRTMAFGGHGAALTPSLTPARFLNDTHWIDGVTNPSISRGGPCDLLFEMTLAWDQARQLLVCVGPVDSPLPNATWEFDGTNWRTGPAPTPAVMSGSAMCYDVLRGRTVRFGGYRTQLSGYSGSRILSADLSEWDGTQWYVQSAVGPSARTGHAMTYDTTRNVVLLFGGSGGTAPSLGLLGDTWRWDGTNWTLLATNGPPARMAAAMTFDPLRSRAVLFGGVGYPDLGNVGSAPPPIGDTWEWDGTAWHEAVPATSPQPRWGARMDYDPAIQRVVLIRGGTPANQTQFAEPWEWDGINWQLRSGSAPPNPDFQYAPVARTGDHWTLVSVYGTWIGSTVVARTREQGNACGGATLPVLRAEGDPTLGASTFAAELHRALPGAPFLLGLGVGTASTPIGAGCTVYLPQLDDTRLGVAGPTGFARIPLPVPGAPQLIGLEVSLQAGALDALAPLGFALSDAVVARIGH